MPLYAKRVATGSEYNAIFAISYSNLVNLYESDTFTCLLGEYSCLKVTLLFKREFSYYLLTIYVPSCMLVIVSWISFWLDSKSVPARVSLGVTTLLTVSTQTAGVNRSLPPVAYTKVMKQIDPFVKYNFGYCIVSTRCKTFEEKNPETSAF